jgi:hypothetical protein
LALQEVSYHTLVHGVEASLAQDKKLPWPPLPFYVGAYIFKYAKEETTEEETLEVSILGRNIP